MARGCFGVVAFVSVVLAVCAQLLLITVLVRLPEYAGLRRLLTWPVRRFDWLTVPKVAGFFGFSTVSGAVGTWAGYDELRLSSRRFVAVLVVIDVAVVCYVVLRSLRSARRPYGALYGVTALVTVSVALLLVRVSPSCEILHPHGEPPMSIQRASPPAFVPAAPNAPMRPILPPPLSTVAPTPPLGPLRAMRLPPLTPGRQPEPTSTPFGGCLTHHHPL